MRTGRHSAAAVGLAALLAVGQAACKTAPPPAIVPAQPSHAEDTAAILRLEDLRVLRDAPDSPRDLTTMARRGDARLRRRAAFAIGRVGDPAGRPALEALLGDAELEVRQSAAFGLGLLGDKAAVPALLAALARGGFADLQGQAR